MQHPLVRFRRDVELESLIDVIFSSTNLTLIVNHSAIGIQHRCRTLLFVFVLLTGPLPLAAFAWCSLNNLLPPCNKCSWLRRLLPHLSSFTLANSRLCWLLSFVWKSSKRWLLSRSSYSATILIKGFKRSWSLLGASMRVMSLLARSTSELYWNLTVCLVLRCCSSCWSLVDLFFKPSTSQMPNMGSLHVRDLSHYNAPRKSWAKHSGCRAAIITSKVTTLRYSKFVMVIRPIIIILYYNYDMSTYSIYNLSISKLT